MSRLDPKTWSNATYPNAAGHVFSSKTSKAAADSVNPRLGKLHKIVLDAFRTMQADMTDNELQANLGGPTVWRPRRVELTALGYLRDSGLTRRTASGRMATIWVLA